MSGLDAGFHYPDIVRAGIHLVLDPPADFQIRVDPDGEKKAEERRRRSQEWQECKRASGIHDEVPPELGYRPPPTKVIHLQWLDEAREPARGEPIWRDTAVHIDLERRRFYQIEGWLIGRRGHSESFGVLFALPVLAVISPYLYVRSRLYRSKERKHGMSRHGIVLLEKLKGQLDAETEKLLAEALKETWTRDRKLGRRVSFEEARDLLVECTLTVHRFGSPEGKPHGVAYYWHDLDHDLVAQAEIVAGSPNPPEVRVLLSRFEGEQALKVMQCYLLKKEEEHEIGSP